MFHPTWDATGPAERPWPEVERAPLRTVREKVSHGGSSLERFALRFSVPYQEI